MSWGQVGSNAESFHVWTNERTHAHTRCPINHSPQSVDHRVTATWSRRRNRCNSDFIFTSKSS